MSQKGRGSQRLLLHNLSLGLIDPWSTILWTWKRAWGIPSFSLRGPDSKCKTSLCSSAQTYGRLWRITISVYIWVIHNFRYVVLTVSTGLSLLSVMSPAPRLNFFLFALERKGFLSLSYSVSSWDGFKSSNTTQPHKLVLLTLWWLYRQSLFQRLSDHQFSCLWYYPHGSYSGTVFSSTFASNTLKNIYIGSWRKWESRGYCF